jgi:hypothetical protein
MIQVFWKVCHWVSYTNVSKDHIASIFSIKQSKNNDPKDEGIKILWNVTNPASMTVSHHRRLESSTVSLQEHQISQTKIDSGD